MLFSVHLHSHTFIPSLILHQIAVFSYAGQNLGQIKNTSKYPKAEYVIETVIKGWFEEHKDADMSYIEKFQQSKSG